MGVVRARIVQPDIGGVNLPAVRPPADCLGRSRSVVVDELPVVPAAVGEEVDSEQARHPSEYVSSASRALIQYSPSAHDSSENAHVAE